MFNPVRRLKEVLGELLAEGRQNRLAAERMAEQVQVLARQAEVQSRRMDTLLEVQEAETLRMRDLAQRHEAESQRLSAMASRLDAAAADTAFLRAKVTGLPAIDPRRVYFGLDELDRRLAAHLDFDNGYFVELGANDGVSQSNTLHFEKYRGWTGLLVEPTPHNFLKCRAVRSPRTRVVCCACTAFGHADRFVEIAFSNLMSTPVGLESDIPDPIAHAEQGRQFLEPTDDIFSFGAVARPLNDVLAEAGAPQAIDLLSLDVEGAEMEVLKGIDHDRFRFRFICVECRDIDRMTLYLGEAGYEMVEKLSHHDYLFRDIRAARA